MPYYGGLYFKALVLHIISINYITVYDMSMMSYLLHKSVISVTYKYTVIQLASITDTSVVYCTC